MLARSLAAVWLFVAAATAAPATAQVVDAPHWLAPVSGPQSCDWHAGEATEGPHC